LKARYCIFFTIATCFSPFTLSIASNISIAFESIECDNLKKFSKSQRDNLVYAYNFGASKGMGYTMAAIAWQESCAGEYMVNFSDPSAGLYHAHIPIVLKYYSSYKDTSFTRNVMGQTLINNRSFSSQVALDTLLYWKKYHKGDYKNTIKSYNKGFKWVNDNASDTLAESYYKNIAKKVRALESYIPRYTSVKNQSVIVELEDKNKAIKQTFKTLQGMSQQSRESKNEPINASGISPSNVLKKTLIQTYLKIPVPLKNSPKTPNKKTLQICPIKHCLSHLSGILRILI